MNLFEKFRLSSKLLAAIKELGIDKPTQIQDVSIPPIMEGKDVIGESATGSGKTLAFGCGIVEKVVPKQGLQSLIMTPTRELAEQVKEVLCKLSKELKTIAIYGGVSIGPQFEDLKRAEIVVATPGRLLDHLERRSVNTSKVKILVLDEADRMLDMGFIDDVEKIIRACPTKRQTLFFSATISDDIKNLAHKYMDKPLVVKATRMVDPSKLKQVYYDIQNNLKMSLLVHLLQHESRGLVMVFCNSRRTVDFVVKNLKANKVSAIAIHGGFTQNKRSHTIELFNNAKVGVLVCTDVAARGLHIDNVSHIYNYEIPRDAKDYVHRIGRTARAGEEGKVINLLSNFDHDNFSRIHDSYNFIISKIERPYLEMAIIRSDSVSSRGPPRGGSRGPPRHGGSRPSHGARPSQGRPSGSPKRSFHRR